MANVFHYLQDITKEYPNYIYTCQPFDKNKIKEKLVEYLKENPKAEICHSKDNKTYESFEVLDHYQLNNKGQLCKSIFKSQKEYLKPIK